MPISREDTETFLTILSDSPYIDVGITLKEQFVKSDPNEVVLRALQDVLEIWLDDQRVKRIDTR